MVWLQSGDFARGWPECEWRLRGQDLPIHRLPQPVWDGAELGGRTILIVAEQGLGDTIQFIRYAPLVARRGGRVVVTCAAEPQPDSRHLPGRRSGDHRGRPTAGIRLPCPGHEPAGHPGHDPPDNPGRGPLPRGRSVTCRPLARCAGRDR